MIVVSTALAGVEHAPPPSGLDRAYAPRRVALIVGIDAYEDPALDGLEFAGKDAADLAAVLQDPLVGGYDVVSTVLGTVSGDTFWGAFRALSSGIQREDTVVVYVAGHGTLDLDGGTALYVMPSDGWLASAPTTGIPVATLSEALEALPARRKVLVLDTCYSGSGRSALDERVRKRIEGLRGPIPAPAALQVSAFSAHLYAAAVNQPAIEDPALANGVYTHFLVEGLRGVADADGDGLVEVMEAHQWARDRTLEHTGGAQVPWAETVAVGRDALYLAGNPSTRREAEHALLTGLERLPDGLEVSVDGVARGAGPLEPGRRRIEVRDGGDLVFADVVDVVRGHDVALDRRVADRADRLELSFGAVVAPERRWLGGVGPAVRVELVPRDVEGPRAWTALTGAVTDGPSLAPEDVHLAGVFAASAGYGPSGVRGRFGPELGAGVAFRGSADGPEVAPTVVPGLRAVGVAGPLLGAFELSSPLFLADGALHASPRLTLSLGVRPGGSR